MVINILKCKTCEPVYMCLFIPYYPLPWLPALSSSVTKFQDMGALLDFGPSMHDSLSCIVRDDVKVPATNG